MVINHPKNIIRGFAFGLFVTTALGMIFNPVISAQMLDQNDLNSIYDDTVWYEPNGSGVTNTPVGGGSGSSCLTATLPQINNPAGLAAAINKFVEDNGGKGSPFDGLGQSIVNGATAAGVNPLLIIAFARNESSFGVNIPPDSYNAFGRMAASGQPSVSSQGSDWYKWNSWVASVDWGDSSDANTADVNSGGGLDEPTYVKIEYISQGLTDLQSLIYKYNRTNPAQELANVTQWFNEMITDAGNAISCSTTSGAPIANFVFYSQYDPRWANTAYGSSGTVSTSGCGPTSAAMIVTNLTGQSVTPDVIATDFGNYHVSGGSSSELMPAVAAKYGLKAVSIGTDLTKAAQALSSGGLVLAGGTGGNPFTADGHIIVLRGINSDGSFLIGDPNVPVPAGSAPNNTNSFSATQLETANGSGSILYMWAVTQ